MMEKKLSKQSEGSATNLWNKYTTDLFFRVTCNLIIFQILLTILIVGGLWFAMEYLVREISQTLIETVSQMLQGQNRTVESVTENIEEVRLNHFWSVMFITVAVILSFGFIMIYVALTPTRLSLERKKRFINNISHELRTPLAIMRTNTDVILLDKEISPKVRKKLERNIIEFNRVTEIMNNLLSLSNVMQDKNFTFVDIDLSTIAHQAVDSLTDIIKHKDIAIQIKTHTHQTVLGNASALEQVVFNLVKNAITHIKSSGTVTIEIDVAADGKYIELSVSDTGSGIPRSDLFHIFEPFYRTRNSHNNNNGQGLGLAIVNEIIQIHRGKIKVKSAVGRGTIVVVSLRCSEPVESVEKKEVSSDMEEVTMDFSRRVL